MSNLSLLRESIQIVTQIKKKSSNKLTKPKSTIMSLSKMEMDRQQLKRKMEKDRQQLNKNEMDRQLKKSEMNEQQFTQMEMNRQLLSVKQIKFLQNTKKEHNRISNICYFMEQVCSKMETITIAMRPTGCIFDPLMRNNIKNNFPQMDGIKKIKRCLSLHKLIPEEKYNGINKIIYLIQQYFQNSDLLSDNERLNAKRYADDMCEAWKSSIKIYLYEDSDQTLNVTSDDNYRPPLQTVPYFVDDNLIVIMKKANELIKQTMNFTIWMGGITHMFTFVDIYNEHYYLCDNIFNTYHH
jgi:hypothetical protein